MNEAAANMTRSWRVLVVEDDRNIRRGIAEVLGREGYEVEEAYDGEMALRAFKHRPADIVCLDIMMPRMDGYEVCRAIRSIDTRAAILIVSAKSQEVDKVLGLNLGADDFIVKPFGAQELAARVRAVVRRMAAPQPGTADQFTMADLEITASALRARRGTHVIDLSPRDLLILSLLYERRGQVVDRSQLFRRAWGQDYLANSRTLDQHISQLRKRIELDPARPAIIQTVHGVGYRFEAES